MATIQYVVNAVDSASGVFAKIAASADGLDKQLGDLSKRIATPEVDLKDSKFTLGIVNAAKRLDKLSAMVADPTVKIDDAKAQSEILKINAQLDRLDKRHVTATVDVKPGRSVLSRVGGLFPGGGAGAGGILRGAGTAGGVIGSGVSAIGQYGQAALISAAVGGGAVLAPAAVPTALGAGLGGLGAFLAAGKQLGKIFSDSFAIIKRDVAPLRPLFVSVFSFLPGLARSIGPALRDVFAESVPFLKMFVDLLKPAAQILLPVFSQSLRQMQPFLPLIEQGLLRIVKGFAGFIQAIGPSGMQASAKIFVVATQVMEAVLIGLGHTVNWLAENIPTWVHDIAKWWDWMRTHTADVFDGIRHDTAHIWDQIFENTIGAVIRFGHNVETQFNSLRHGILGVIDDISSGVTASWRQFWTATVGGWLKAGFDKISTLLDIERHVFAVAFDDIRHLVADAWNATWQATIGTAIRAFKTLMNATTGFRQDVGAVFDALRHDTAIVWKAIWDGVVAATRLGVRLVGAALNGLKGAFAAPINFVIDNILDPMVHIWDTIVGAVGQKNLRFSIPNVHFAEGGMVSGGIAGRDSVLARLMPGEVVVPTRMVTSGAVDHLRGSLPGFAAGGKVGNPAPGRFPGLSQPKPGSAPFGGGVASDIGTWIGKSLSWVTGHAFGGLTGLLGGIPGADGVAHLAGGMARTLIADAAKGIVHAVSSLLGGSSSEIVKYAASFLGKIPYVWGGTAVPGGADCSGFTQAVYKRFGYNAPRTSEEQGSWVRRTAPTPGGLVFFNSPAGGPPPGHVGIVMNGSQMISQAGPEGALGPTVSSIAGRMFAGIPPSGFGGGVSSTKGRFALSGLESLWDSVGGPAGVAHIAGAIALAESGGNPGVRNPSGASGLWQILGQVVGGNIFNPTVNAENAVRKYRDAGGFSPWVTYTSGAYRQFMGNGGVIREPITGIGRSGRMYGFGERGPETVTPGTGGAPGGMAVKVTLEVKTGAGATALDRAIVDVIQKYVIVHGGDAQAALGQRA